MSSGITIHPLSNFSLDEITGVELAVSTLGEELHIGSFVRMEQVETQDSTKSTWKYSNEDGSVTEDLIFNSIVLFGKSDNILAYAMIDPQALNTVITWYVTIDIEVSSSTIEDMTVNLDVVYNEHTINTSADNAETGLNAVHTDLTYGSAFNTASQLSLDDTIRQSALVISPTESNITTQFEQLSIPSEDAPESSNYQVHLNMLKQEDGKAYKFYSPDTLNTIDGKMLEHENFNSNIKVRSFMTTSLGAYCTPALIKYLIYGGDGLNGYITIKGLIKSYKRASIFFNGERNFGFFLPLITEENNLIGCVLLPSGAYQEIIFYKFTTDISLDQSNFIPSFYRAESVNIIQLGGKKSVYWQDNKPYDPYGTKIEKEEGIHPSSYSGFENAWLETEAKGDEATYNYVIYRREVEVSESEKICMSPSLNQFGYYLELTEGGPSSLESFIHYCIDARNSVESFIKEEHLTAEPQSFPNNYIVNTLFNALAEKIPQLEDPEQELGMTLDTNSPYTIIVTLKNNASIDLIDENIADILNYETIMEKYKLTYSSSMSPTAKYSLFQGFINEYGSERQTIARLESIGSKDNKSYLDKIPEPPGYYSDNYPDYSRQTTMMKQFSDLINNEAKIIGLTETDTFNKFIGPDQNCQYMFSDNGVVKITTDDSYYYVTVLKYTGKQDNRFFRHVIPKSTVKDLLVSYSTNILSYRMVVGSSDAEYTSIYDLNSSNPYLPILSNNDIFEGTSSGDTHTLGISTLYYANGLLFITDYNTNYINTEYDVPYVLEEDPKIIRTSGKKLIRRVFYEELGGA